MNDLLWNVENLSKPPLIFSLICKQAKPWLHFFPISKHCIVNFWGGCCCGWFQTCKLQNCHKSMRNVEFLRLQNRISWKHFKLLNTQTYLETKTNNAFSIYGMDIQNGDLKKKTIIHRRNDQKLCNEINIQLQSPHCVVRNRFAISASSSKG